MFVYASLDGCVRLDFNDTTSTSVYDVKLAICDRVGIPVGEQRVLIDGKDLHDSSALHGPEVFCRVLLRGLLGGKGGFGSVIFFDDIDDGVLLFAYELTIPTDFLCCCFCLFCCFVFG
jgi:hypothetical protein